MTNLDLDSQRDVGPAASAQMVADSICMAAEPIPQSWAGTCTQAPGGFVSPMGAHLACHSTVVMACIPGEQLHWWPQDQSWGASMPDCDGLLPATSARGGPGGAFKGPALKPGLEVNPPAYCLQALAMCMPGPLCKHASGLNSIQGLEP